MKKVSSVSGRELTSSGVMIFVQNSHMRVTLCAGPEFSRVEQSGGSFDVFRRAATLVCPRTLANAVVRQFLGVLKLARRQVCDREGEMEEPGRGKE